MWFDGSCPFLLCFETAGHSHPICPECGAVRYGNMFCKTCQTEGKEYHERHIAELKATHPELFMPPPAPLSDQALLLQVWPTDRRFHEGEPNDICSRCGQRIPEGEVPILMWPATDPPAYMYQFHPKCLGLEVTPEPEW